MSNIINIRDELNKIDLRTDNYYDLRNLYESVRLSDTEKKQLAKLLSEGYEPKYIYSTLNSKLTAPSRSLNEHWTDVYRQFIEISDNSSSESEAEREIDALYAENEGNPDYELAMDKWLDAPYLYAPIESDKPLYVIRDKHGRQLSAPNHDDQELWDRVSAMEMRGRTGLSVVAYTKEIEEEVKNTKLSIVDDKGNEVESKVVPSNQASTESDKLIQKAQQKGQKVIVQDEEELQEAAQGLYPGDGKWDKLTEEEKASYKYDEESGKYFKESLSDNVKSIDGFNVGDTIVANTDIFFSTVHDIEDDERIMNAVTDGGFIKRDRVVFPKGTIFELIDVVNNYPVVREKSTGVELDFSDLSTDFDLVESTNESLVKNPDPVNGAYSKENIERDLKYLTNNFTREDTLKCGFEEEDKYAQEILGKHYNKVSSEKQGEWFVITFSEPKSSKVNESFPMNDGINLDRVCIQVANLLGVDKLGEDNWIELVPVRDARPHFNGEYILHLECFGPNDSDYRRVTFTTNKGDIDVAFKNGSEAKCNSVQSIARFIAGEYGVALNESKLTEASNENMKDIDSLILIGGGTDECVKLINDVRVEYPGIDNDELADILENMNDDLYAIEWLSVIEYLDEYGKFGESLTEDDSSENRTVGLYGDEVPGMNSVDEIVSYFEKKGLTVSNVSGDMEYGWEMDVAGKPKSLFTAIVGTIPGYNPDDVKDFIDEYAIDDLQESSYEMIEESTPLKEYTYDDSHMKVEVVYENEGYKVEYHPTSGRPYWIIDKSEVNPLHPVDTFYDKERAIEWADDYDEEDRIDSTYHDYSADELGRMDVYGDFDDEV